MQTQTPVSSTLEVDGDLDSTQLETDRGGILITMPDQEPRASALEVVADYYLNPTNLPGLKSEKRKQLALMAIAFSGAPLYAIPASNYSTRFYGDNLGLRINFIIGTCTPALVVLYNATDIFLMLRAAGRPPEALKEIFKSHVSSKQDKLEDFGIILGSALSAMPLTVISLAYPIPGIPKAVVALLAAAVQFDNTVLHFLPIKLALSQPLYRLPALPFEYFYKNFIKKVPDEKMQIENAKQAKKNEIYNTYKGSFLVNIGRVRKNIALNGFKFDFLRLKYKLDLPPEVMTAFSIPGESSLTRLSAIMTYTLPINPKPMRSYEPILRKGLSGLGAFWVISSCSGYLAATVTQLDALTKDLTAGIILSAPSIYFLTVLFAFFGGQALNDVYDYLTSWDSDDLKIAMEFKLFPKISTFLMLVTLYLTAFSYAAADELIQDNFEEDEIDGLFTLLVWLAITGAPFLSFTALIGFSQRMLGKVALHYGDRETKFVAELDGMLTGLQIGTNFIPGEDFMNSLAVLPASDLEKFTGMTTTQLQQSREELASIDDEPEVDVGLSPRVGYTALGSRTPSVSDLGMFGASAPSPAASPSITATRSLISGNDRQLNSGEVEKDDEIVLARCHTP